MSKRFINLGAVLLLAMLVFGLTSLAEAQEPAKLVINMESRFPSLPDRWDGQMKGSVREGSGSYAYDREFTIDVFYYRQSSDEFSVVFKLSDPNVRDAGTSITLFPGSRGMQTMIYQGVGKDLDSAVKDLERSVQSYVGDRMTMAVTHDGPNGSPRFTLQYQSR